MSGHDIHNWCETKLLTVKVASINSIARHGPFIHIVQDAGSMYFQHTITPDQARKMAQALIELAAEAEAIAEGVAA